MLDETVDYLKLGNQTLANLNKDGMLANPRTIALVVAGAANTNAAAICSELAALRQSIDKIPAAFPDADKLLGDLGRAADSVGEIANSGLITR